MTDSPPSLFAQPAPSARRRHRRRSGAIASQAHPIEGPRQRREIIDLHIRDAWREAADEGCSAEAWSRAALVDTYLRAERLLVG